MSTKTSILPISKTLLLTYPKSPPPQFNLQLFALLEVTDKLADTVAVNSWDAAVSRSAKDKPTPASLNQDEDDDNDFDDDGEDDDDEDYDDYDKVSNWRKLKELSGE